MVHPTRLLRTHSDEGASQFSAPIDAVDANTIDCGIKKLPCLNALNLERFATPRWFLVVLSGVGLLQGAVLSYFRGTSKIWTQHYNFPAESVEWLVYTNEVFSGIFALCVAYYGNKFHRASWLGGLVIYQSIASLVLSVPEAYRPYADEVVDNNVTNLCVPSLMEMSLLSEKNADIATMVVLFLYQLLFSFATISFVCHGVSYLDDSVKSADSASYIAGALASKELGKQFGMYLAWVPHYNQTLVFRSPVWLVLGVATFIIGCLAAMFPKNLPTAILKDSVASILDIAQGIEREEDNDANKQSDGFWTTFYRLLKNRLLILNIFASVFMTASIVNFQIFQNTFFQSRFLISVSADESGFSDTYLAQIIANLLKQPFIAISLIASGVIISKMRPKARNLAAWNLSILVLVMVMFIPHAFFTCSESIQSEYDRYLTYYCNSNCDCDDNVIFSPVCTEIGQKTYFSPCHAGCTTVQTLNNVKIYGNCSCGELLHVKVNGRATEGSCGNCDVFWALAQVSLITSAGLIASTIIPNILINLRCIESSDKAVALALWLTFVGTLPFVPFKLIYSLVAGSLCRYRNDSGKCLLHSHHFGTFLSVASIALMIVAALFTMLVIVFVKDLDLYDEEDGENEGDDPVELEDVANQQQQGAGGDRNHTLESDF